MDAADLILALRELATVPSAAEMEQAMASREQDAEDAQEALP